MMASAIFWLSGLYWPEVTCSCSAATRLTRTSGTLAKLALRLCRSLCRVEMLTVSSPAAGLAPEVLLDWPVCTLELREFLTWLDCCVAPRTGNLGSIFMSRLLGPSACAETKEIVGTCHTYRPKLIEL